MIRRACLFSFLAACTIPLCGAEKAPPESLTSFGASVEVNVVNVDVYVTDRDGKRVTDLKRQDFAVSEDGKPVEVTNFAAISSGRAGAATAPAEGAKPAPAAAGSVPPATAPAPDPETVLSLVVFIDDLHLRPENRTKAVEQIRTFLARSIRPGDRVMVASHGIGLRLLQPFTEDRAAVDKALKQAETSSSQGQSGDEERRSAFRALKAMQSISFCALENVQPVELYASQARDEALRTVGALTVLINSLAGVPGHRALLLVSDGISITPGEELFQVLAELCGGSTEPGALSSGNRDLIPRGSDDSSKYNPQQAALDAQKYNVAKRFEDLASHASANRVTLYTLQASGLQGFAASSADYDPEERGLLSSTVQQIQISNLRGSLTALAADTGGRAILDANDLGPELARVEEDFEAFYSLGYTPAHHGDGKQHKIEVKVKQPGLRVRYRPSYRDKPALEKAVDRTLTALLHRIEDNPLEVAVELGEQTLDKATGTWAVPVKLKIPLYKLAIIHPEEGGPFRGRLRLLVAVLDGKGGISPVRQVEVPIEISRKEVLNALGQHYLYTLTLKMPAGEQRVAVAVRDDLGATTSYLSRAVSVGAVRAAVPAPEAGH